jgi:hypothetical protein
MSSSSTPNKRETEAIIKRDKTAKDAMDAERELQEMKLIEANEAKEGEEEKKVMKIFVKFEEPKNYTDSKKCITELMTKKKKLLAEIETIDNDINIHISNIEASISNDKNKLKRLQDNATLNTRNNVEYKLTYKEGTPTQTPITTPITTPAGSPKNYNLVPPSSKSPAKEWSMDDDPSDDSYKRQVARNEPNNWWPCMNSYGKIKCMEFQQDDIKHGVCTKCHKPATPVFF